MEKEMKTKTKTSAYIAHSIAVAVLLLTAQISLAGSATWLLSPQDSAWENVNNWTPGGPPNGPSDIATFAQSSQTEVVISTSEEVNSIAFNPGSASFRFLVFAALIISGTGVHNNSGVLQTFVTDDYGQIIFNNASTAASAQMNIVNSFGFGGQTIFNDSSNAAAVSISNYAGLGGGGLITFNDTSSAGHASIRNYGPTGSHLGGGNTIFNGTSTAANASISNDGAGPFNLVSPLLHVLQRHINCRQRNPYR